MSQQKAIFLESLRGDFVLRTTEIYKPGRGEILVKIRAAALNPADWKVQKYETDFMKFPSIVGSDVAGDVVEIGEDVRGLSRVIKSDYTNRNSGLQQYTIAPAHRTAKIPAGWSYDEIATIPLALFTAWSGLYNKPPHGLGLTGPTSLSDVSKGKYDNIAIVILGGSTSVGQMVIQLAKYSGFSPIITTASLKNESYLKSLGATHVVDRSLPLSSLPSEVAKITSEQITVAFDAAAIPELAQAGYDLLTNGGRLGTAYPKLKLKETEGSGKTIANGVALPEAPPENAELIKAIYGMLTSFLESGAIRPNRVEVLPNGLGSVFEGLDRLKNDQVSARKLIVHPDETK
ncbi:chaperonin 10-like protein [Cyathus striatus]|nr:chaperonin 10-like protein [Cyathus striatus]